MFRITVLGVTFTVRDEAELLSLLEWLEARA